MTSASFGRMPAARFDTSTWMTAAGIVSIVLGILGLIYAFVATLVSVMFIGWLLIFGGVVLIAHAFSSRTERRLLSVVGGVLYIIVGFLLVSRPLLGAEALTLLMAAFFLVGGLFRIGAGLSMRFVGRGWLLLNGLILFLLGILVFAAWPVSSVYMLGVYVSVGLIAEGLSMLLIRSELRDTTPSGRLAM